MPTITELALDTPELSTLVTVLQFIDAETGADLVGTLNADTTDVTVFAPTNAAFANLAQALGLTDTNPSDATVIDFLTSAPTIGGTGGVTLTAEVLRDVVLYHVSAGGKKAADIAALEADGDPIETLLGVDITPSLPSFIDGEPDLTDPMVVGPPFLDIEASNGIVHAIDNVLIPLDLPDAPSLTEIVTADDGEFDILQQAVVAAGLADDLDSNAVDLTVFAPTDAAFMNVAALFGYTGTDETEAFGTIAEALTLFSAGESPIPLLTDILLYHVVPDNVQVYEVADGAVVPTLLTDATFEVSVTSGGVELIDNDPDTNPPVTITATGFQASNGVAHVIDNVLLPADLLKSDGSDDVDFILADDRGNKIHTGADNDLVDGNGGSDRLDLGLGNDIGLGGDGHDFILGKSGHDTISGGAGNDILGAGKGKDVASGGEGDDIIFGGRGGDMLNGGAGGDIIGGGRGRDTIEGGEGRDLLTLGGGADTLVFNEGDGRDLVFDFDVDRDKIDLTDFGFANFAAFEDSIDDRFFRTKIDLEGGSITLLGVDSDELTADNFLF